jgi:hypothetical protein
VDDLMFVDVLESDEDVAYKEFCLSLVEDSFVA